MAQGTDVSTEGPDRHHTVKSPERRKRNRRRSDGDGAAGVRIVHDAALATLDKFNRGVLLLDADGAVSFANRAAQAMLARNDGLQLRRERLQFTAADATAAFQAFLFDTKNPVGDCGLVLRLESPHIGGAYRVLVSRLALRRDADRDAGYCVFIYEPNGGQKPLPVPLLMHLYRLTAAVARLTNELFIGRSLAEGAKASGITINTAKSVLKAIFTKCAVGSQSELLLLLSLGPRTL
jgi:PAS domain-containing protein